MNEPADSHVPTHVRREELIRPEGKRRDFPERQARRRLQQKEVRWAPYAYAVFAVAVVVIFCIAYMTYAFSEYRGVILPGVQVDQTSLSGLTEKQAANLISYKLALMHQVPVRLTYGPLPPWEPTKDDIGLGYQETATAREAMAVGRAGSFLRQLVDRLPFHPTHYIPLVYDISVPRLSAYIRTQIQPKIYKPAQNARIVRAGGTFSVVSAHRGLKLDVGGAIASVQAVLGSLTKQTVALRATHTMPAITDADATRVLDRVNLFLTHTPIIAAGRHVFVSSQTDVSPMLSFYNDLSGKHPSIVMQVHQDAIHQYISTLAAQVNRPALNARMQFSGGKVIVLQPRQTGRTLDETAAYSALVKVIAGLRPNAHLHFTVATTQPPVDVANPASLGINKLLAVGQTSFVGASDTRLNAVMQIAKTLDKVVLQPNQEISFNTLVGQNWDANVYTDHERRVKGQLVPGNKGAMQQVATTFLRAMYNTGLKLIERHAHLYRLPWYEPPVGYDAVVDPGRNWDLRFLNNTGRYLLIETRVEPIRKELYIYVYGADQKWKIAVDSGKILKTFPHGQAVIKQDPTLPPGVIQQVAWPEDGATTVIQRTITYPNGNVKVDEIDTHYAPQQAIMVIGAQPKPTATPGPKAQATSQAAAIPSVPAPPTPTPTFSH